MSPYCRVSNLPARRSHHSFPRSYSTYREFLERASFRHVLCAPLLIPFAEIERQNTNPKLVNSVESRAARDVAIAKLLGVSLASLDDMRVAMGSPPPEVFAKDMKRRSALVAHPMRVAEILDLHRLQGIARSCLAQRRRLEQLLVKGQASLADRLELESHRESTKLAVNIVKLADALRCSDIN